MANVKTLHPSLTAERRSEWRLMRHCMNGESAIKRQGEVYLPKPSGFSSQLDQGLAMYDAYRARAQFPALLAPSVGAMIGIIHGTEIDIQLPKALDYLWEDSDGDGLPLEAFHSRITSDLLITGGYVVLTDAPSGGGDPYLVGFSRNRLINWDSDWFVIDETRMVRDGFDWNQVEKYRVLEMDGGRLVVKMYSGEMHTGVEIEVKGRGGAPLNRVPIAVGNAMDLSASIETPPLIGVANAAQAIYQLSADYRHQLYMSGQETGVVINGAVPDGILGAGVIIELQGSPDQTPDFKYVGPDCAGIKAHKEAMADSREAAVMAGARLFEQTAAGAESGEAKRLRYASETATLTSVAQSSCLIIERALKNAAMIAGANEDEVIVTPPSDLMDRTMSPQDFAALFGVYADGGMSWETFFANGQQGGIFPADQDAESEQKLLDGPTGQEEVV